MFGLKEIVENLEALGSAETIAAKLQSLGIRGQVNHCWFCPIARYISKQMKRSDLSIMVTNQWITAFNDDGRTKEYVLVSPILKDFIIRVDSTTMTGEFREVIGE